MKTRVKHALGREAAIHVLPSALDLSTKLNQMAERKAAPSQPSEAPPTYAEVTGSSESSTLSWPGTTGAVQTAIEKADEEFTFKDRIGAGFF